MKTFELTNDFHHTRVSVRVPEERMEEVDAGWNIGKRAQLTLSPRQFERVERLLCGMPDCQCGGMRGDGQRLEDLREDRVVISVRL